MTQTLTIMLVPDAAGADVALLRARLQAVPDVVDPRPLEPGSTVPEVRRMWVADVPDTADAAGAAQQLRSLPEIESAAVAAERGLDG